MNPGDHEFRERLIQAQPVTPALKEQYSKEIKKMFVKELQGFRRWVWLGCAIMGIAFTCLFGTMAVVLPAEFPWWGRVGFAAGSLFGIGWAILGARVFWHGSLNLKRDTKFSAGLAWGLPVMLVTVFMVWSPDTLAGLRMILSALVFLVMGAMFMIQNCIEQSEYKTREKLLEIEYQLAELADAVQRKG